MNNIDIEKMKREIKVKVGGTVVFCGLLLSLMGCGKTVVDTTVEQQPTQTIETTVDDPVVDVPVEPTVDVSDNEEITPVGENRFEDATLVQTGENSYTLYVDCPDSSITPEMHTLLDACFGPYITTYVEDYGISDNLITAVLAYGIRDGSTDLLISNLNNHKDNTMNINSLYGSFGAVITDNAASYSDDYRIYPMDDGDYSRLTSIYSLLLRDSLDNTNGNISCAAARVYSRPDAWNQIMQECMDATGLTEKEIYDNYDANYILQYDTLGLCDHDCANIIMSYLGNDPVEIRSFDSNGLSSICTYTIEISKALRLK